MTQMCCVWSFRGSEIVDGLLKGRAWGGHWGPNGQRMTDSESGGNSLGRTVGSIAWHLGTRIVDPAFCWPIEEPSFSHPHKRPSRSSQTTFSIQKLAITPRSSCQWMPKMTAEMNSLAHGSFNMSTARFLHHHHLRRQHAAVDCYLYTHPATTTLALEPQQRHCVPLKCPSPCQTLNQTINGPHILPYTASPPPALFFE